MMSLKSSSLSSLPFDLVEEILARVSASSLKRLRTTCKQWNVLLSDQRFTNKHFDKAEKQFRVAMLRRRTVCSMSLNLFGLHDNIDPSIEVKFNLMMAFVFEVFHCSGLLLCKTGDDRLLVWNPCMGQPKWIKTNIPSAKNFKYALGYENNKSCYNYKILKYDLDETFDLEIYEFNSNSWRVLDSVTPDFTIARKANGVSIMGNSYWIASHIEEEYLIDDFLISFDFTTERFGPRVCLPCSYCDTISLSCVREDRLSVFFQDSDTSKMEIWMTNNITQTKAMSWSPFFKIDLNTHRFGTDVSFFIDEENKVIVCCDEDEDEDDDMNDFVYIIGEDQYWRKVDIGQKSNWPRIFSYAPSLLQI
ncbi:PREDICTED: putative F-box/kelch-repeat protein At1g62270 [Camelina sativa]|uniref:F-box/kelch-repeat protein At1g62270 n=1 Tax=Camelina sativa TaxID=90675 RepID=A0ABM1QGH5_CAMSA|nr:PREDICTED: putative F-box/kelch-repeat protein At1g62270 [Camelina sativa]